MIKKYNFDYSDWHKEVEKVKKITRKNHIEEHFLSNDIYNNFKSNQNFKNVHNKKNNSLNQPDNNKFKAFDLYLYEDKIFTPQSYIDKNILKKINNNKIKIDRSLDLHNFFEEEARLKFFNFIQDSYLKSYKYLLVITGKGNKKEVNYLIDKSKNSYAVNQGILYNSFFSWIEDLSVRNYIVGYSHANNKHGGSGAFYVMIKTNKF